jgi:hypothetical protein
LLIKITILLLALLCSGHAPDLFPNNEDINTRQNYADNLEDTLVEQYKSHFSVSLYGNEMEHILIVSSACPKLKNYILTDALKIGFISAVCRWWGQKIPIKVK